MKPFLEWASENPILIIVALFIVGYTLVEMTAIIVLHHTVNF